MKYDELKNRIIQAQKNINIEARKQPNCRSSQGTRDGLEYASYEIECAMDKRKRKDMSS